ncbi:soluble NSF attachment protein (SNAP)-like [Scopulibacillus darangshiensis]|uniref:Soluble NSF attachment protein (SNAP)-like n=1 Tax=Scopulibacillus darangshiensis TaxID=442528 RepID=A0A4R2P756_9BACL|nr:helix-turn-helix domain-containing protein [Scopulibacillus darangshiensis]TCP29821.1 soluble NSF attachment protein (SNAP)-like [Scopulibacillus darangshiensis]
MTIGQEIKKRRKELGLTLEQAAGNFMSISQLSNIENNKTSLSPQTWSYLKRTLQIEFDLLAAKEIEDELNYLSEKAKTLSTAGLVDQAIDTYQMILIKSAEGFLIEPQADAYLALGELFLIKKMGKEAVAAFLKAAEFYEALQDNDNRGHSVMKIGVTYFNQGKYRQAINHFDTALNIVANSLQRSIKGCLFYNLASTYYKIKDVDRAASYCERALLHLTQNEPRYLIGTYNLQAILYAKMNMPFTAKDKLTQAKSLAESIQDSALIAKSLHNIGFIESQLKHFDNAAKYLSLSLEIKKANKNELGILRTQLAVSSLHFRNGDISQAVDTLNQALASARKKHYISEEIACLNLLRHIYLKRGEETLYLDHTFKALSLAESLNAVNLQIDILHDLAEFYLSKSNIKAYYNTLDECFKLQRKYESDGDDTDGEHPLYPAAGAD